MPGLVGLGFIRKKSRARPDSNRQTGQEPLLFVSPAEGQESLCFSRSSASSLWVFVTGDLPKD